MDRSDFSRSGYDPSNSTMDDNVGHTSNDTSALTSLDEDPFGGSRSLENPEYSDTGDGDDIVRTVDTYDAAQHDLEMSWINHDFEQEWPSSKPNDLHASQQGQSQGSMSVYDVQPEAEPTNISQLNGERPPQQYNNVTHARHSQSFSTDHPHPPVLAIHDGFYCDHLNLAYAGPSAQGHDHTRLGFEKNNATRNAPYFSHGDDLGDKVGKCYNVHSHQGRHDTFFAPPQTLAGGRDPPWSTITKPNNREEDLHRRVEGLVVMIDPPKVNHTSGFAGKAHSLDVSMATLNYTSGIAGSGQSSEGITRPVETFQSNSINYMDDSGLGSCCEGLEGLAMSGLPTRGQVNGPMNLFQSTDGYDMTPIDHPRHLEISAFEVQVPMPTALPGSASSNVLRCPLCPAEFRGPYGRGNLGRHRRQKHNGPAKSWACEDEYCSKVFLRADARLKHYRHRHPGLALRPQIAST